MKKKEKRLVKQQALEWLQFREKSVTKSSFATYQYVIRKHIIPNVGDCDVNDAETARRILLEMSKGYRDVTRSGIMTVFNSIMRFNSDSGSKSKRVKINCDEKTDIIPKDQFAMFMVEVRTDINPTKLGILCVIYTGIKISELCSLKWKNVDLVNNVIKVDKNVQRIYLNNEDKKTVLDEKDIPIRYIPIPTKLLRILLSRVGRLDDYLITGNSKQVEPRTAQNRLFALCRKTGLSTKITYQKLRDYFAINALVNNVNAIVVADILGLEFDMMQKYLEVAQNLIDMENEIEKLNHI